MCVCVCVCVCVRLGSVPEEVFVCSYFLSHVPKVRAESLDDSTHYEVL